MRIAIVGAGAIGCYLGARLARKGHEVIVQGRPEQVAALNDQGLLVRLPDGREERQPLRATTDLTTEPDFSPQVILLTVKTQDVAEACAPLTQLAPRTPIVTLQNGLRADEMAAQVVGRGRVVGGVVMSAIAYLRPGEIEAQFPGWLIVGEPWGRPGARARELRDLLNDATPTFVARDLAAVRWSKLIANLNNGLCAATGQSLAELARSPLGRRLSLAVMREGAAVAHAQGIHLDHGLYGLAPRMLRQNPGTAPLALLNGLMPALLDSLPTPLAERIIGLTARSALGRLPVRGSTWQSIARGRATEIDYLNGEISRRGTALGVPTPVNDAVTATVRQVAETREFVTLEALESIRGVEMSAQTSVAHAKEGNT